MNPLFATKNPRRARSGGHLALACLALLVFCSLPSVAQNVGQPSNADTPFSIRATHLLGFENAKTNCAGTLSIHDNVLQFQQGGRPGAQVKITSVEDVFLGGESKQVGGLPMTLGKAAAPFGGGRVVSLFAHKNYDTLTLEYVDSNGGAHGAIFQLDKGQGELVRDQLMARGLRVRSRDDRPTKQTTPEVTHETN
jgi:hypothetical protein